MGDRANFGFRKDANSPTVYLYGHWAGHGMLARLANALLAVEAHGRLTDDAYGTRIAVSQIVGEDWAGGLGWGITVDEVADNEHSIPVVDWAAGTVTLYDAVGWPVSLGTPKFTMNIHAFIRKFAKENVYA